MKLSTGLFLPTLIGVASALQADATVYILRGRESLESTSNPPTLTPEQARLVFAQRLGVSHYHGLGDSGEDTLSYINHYGGGQKLLFSDGPKDKEANLIIVVEGIEGTAIDGWPSIEPAFTISTPPSTKANEKLVQHLNQQAGQVRKDCDLWNTINPFDTSCWEGKAKAIHLDLASKVARDDFVAIQARLEQFAKKAEMNVAIVFMPTSSRTCKTSSNPYGTYEKASQVTFSRREIFEEPMTDGSSFHVKKLQTNSSTKYRPIVGIAPVCYATLDSCEDLTNSCSGHGQCYNNTRKGGAKGGCFSCACLPTQRNFTYADGTKKGFNIDHWGGGACQKKDVSGPFWLIAISSVILMGLVGWAIGLIFSIGEETLPGVIGAGVPSKTR